MDFINKIANQATGGADHNPQQGQPHNQQQEHNKASSSGSLFDKLHGLAGGGPESEKKEDTLDKAIDLVQEKLLNKGPQNNENAAEQAKDKFIADTIRSQYKSATGKDFPLGEKEKKQQEEKKSGGFGGLF